MTDFVLVIDQSTTSSSAFAFSKDAQIVAHASREFQQYYPNDGWVEHDAEEIWQSVLTACRDVLADPKVSGWHCVGVGITNQRETSVIWHRKSGQPIGPAIVWQDRRTAAQCENLRAAGHEALIQEKTGLLLDPYFSASKICWMLDHTEGARAAAQAGELAFGTIESWLIWKFTGGAHVSDITNASRTSLVNINARKWDNDLLALFNIPPQILPEICDNVSEFGQLKPEHLGISPPILAAIGDQQGASFGQRCMERGQMKSTYGTGCFALINTGAAPVISQNRLLSTVAYSLEKEATYALEGSIFMAGAIVQWMRDNMNFFNHASESEVLARSADPKSGVVMVPAFTGLGAPHWDPSARGTIMGLTRDSGVAEIVRAGLESVSLQTQDLLLALAADMNADISHLRVDGGMVANDWFAQNLADITGLTVERSPILETTALGAAYLALLGAGVFARAEDIGRQVDAGQVFKPAMDVTERSMRLARWHASVQKARHQVS